MIFAKIDFINLLPFYVFIKKHIVSTQIKQIIEYKKSYPSKINKKFKKRKIDAAFISSIKSKGCSCLDAGIVAKKDVNSVLILKTDSKKDYQSDTSNMLANVLNLNGEVIIGDKALTFFYNNPQVEFIDLAKYWNDKYHLPFVFARLCVNNHKKQIKEISDSFLKTNVKIPQYILKRYAQKTNIKPKQINEYLKKISYEINHKEKLALKKFFKLQKKKG